MTISTQVLIILIGVAYPIFCILTYKKTNKRLKSDENYRTVEYKRNIFIFWMLTFLVIGNSYIDRSIPLSFYPAFNTIGIVLAFLILFFIGLQIFTSQVTTLKKAESIFQTTKDISHYLPKSSLEYFWFNLLSISAGIGEEIIFRLFLFSFLLANTNLAVAFIVTNIIFALTHIGSSNRNILNAFILGLIFTAVYYFSDNIWLSIILHSSIDLNLGYFSYQAHKFKRRH